MISFTCSMILLCLCYIIFSLRVVDKEFQYEIEEIEEGKIEVKKRVFTKSIYMIVINLLLFGFILYTMTGFVIVFKNYDIAFLLSFVIIFLLDFVLFEIIGSLLLAIFKTNGKVGKVIIKITSWRCGT
jgi:hypothetical protein